MPDGPLVLAGQDGGRRCITAADRAAQALGLRPGMALAQATAAVPGLVVADADPEGDAAALRRLAGWCRRWSPLVAPAPPDGLWLDMAGAIHLSGSEAALLEGMVRRFAAAGLEASAAIADTPGAAHAAARHGALRVVPPGGQRAVLGPMPLAALRLPRETVQALHHVALDRVEQLLALPRAMLVRRFGPELALRLDQALGHAAEPVMPLLPEKEWGRREAFVEPLLTAEALSQAVTLLVGPLCARMEAAGLGARRLDLLFHRVDGTVQAIRIGTARPSRDPRHLARLLDERIETVDPGLGIEAMHLLVPHAERLAWRQDADALRPAEADLSALIDRLSNRFGAGRVYRAAPVESDVPERTVRQVPALAPAVHAAWPLHLPAPVRLLHPPQPVEAGPALLPDHPPRSFVWRRRRHQVRHADGPARVHGEWWRRDREVWAVRDYFRVEDEDGARFWLFRQGDGVHEATGGLSWFVHGLF